MAITAQEKYLLNKMNSTAAKVQLGTLIENAENVIASEIALADGKVLVGGATGVAAAQTLSGDISISNTGVAAIGSGVIVNADLSGTAAVEFSKLEALTSAYILVGNVSNVAAKVAMSGDTTISNAGVVAIGAGKVLETMLAVPTSAALNAHRIARAVFDPSAVAGDRTIAAHSMTVTLPDNAVITRAWYDVITTFTSATDAATIAIHVEGANDVVTATAISAGGNVWDAGLHEAIQVGTAATMVKTSAARAITATVASEELTAGKLVLFLEYTVSA